MRAGWKPGPLARGRGSVSDSREPSPAKILSKPPLEPADKSLPDTRRCARVGYPAQQPQHGNLRALSPRPAREGLMGFVWDVDGQGQALPSPVAKEGLELTGFEPTWRGLNPQEGV